MAVSSSSDTGPMANNRGRQIEQDVAITAAPTQVLAAFFDPEALAVWWRTTRAITTPRPLGIYAVEWRTSPFQDDVFGTLGGVFYGTVMEFRNGRQFFVADAYWLPPENDPIGPMGLEVTCHVAGPGTRLHVRQGGPHENARWGRYYDLLAAGWADSLKALKRYMEQGADPLLPPRGLAPDV